MATEHHGTVESTEPPHGQESGGLPQLQFQHWGGQIVWLLLIFAVLYAVLSKALLPRVSGAIEERGAMPLRIPDHFRKAIHDVVARVVRGVAPA